MIEYPGLKLDDNEGFSANDIETLQYNVNNPQELYQQLITILTAGILKRGDKFDKLIESMHRHSENYFHFKKSAERLKQRQNCCYRWFGCCPSKIADEKKPLLPQGKPSPHYFTK